MFPFHHSFESYHFLDFIAEKTPLIHWMLDAKSPPIDMPIDSFQYILCLIITLG